MLFYRPERKQEVAERAAGGDSGSESAAGNQQDDDCASSTASSGFGSLTKKNNYGMLKSSLLQATSSRDPISIYNISRHTLPSVFLQHHTTCVLFCFQRASAKWPPYPLWHHAHYPHPMTRSRLPGSQGERSRGRRGVCPVCSNTRIPETLLTHQGK